MNVVAGINPSIQITGVSVRMATEDDASLPVYDNTKLQAVNTCPTWGVLRYGMHKVFSANGRAMALEAGSAMHEVFAAVRLWQLWKYDLPTEYDYHHHELSASNLNDPMPELTTVRAAPPRLVQYHGERLFGKERFGYMLEEVQKGEDERTQYLNFCLQALYSSGFYDDPHDTRRTMSNLEEAAIMYCDRWDFVRHPIWIRDISDPESDVGIEIAFDVVISYTFSDGSERSYRFAGKLDGLHVRDQDLVVGENKTGARLDEAWIQSFEMSSQVTGYCLAASVFAQRPIDRAIIWGVAIPLPKAYDSGLTRTHVQRPSYMFERWFSWFLHSVQMYEAFENNPIDAPKYTHSCNRYFRPCAYIPFCTVDDEEQRLIITEMVDDEWSPLHDAKATG